MAFVSKTKSKSKSNLPDYQLLVKIPTSKGLVTLGKIGLYKESKLHEAVIGLDPASLSKLISKAELVIAEYESSNEDAIQLLLD